MKIKTLPPLYLLLASMSRYRAECLEKLQIPFQQWAPHIDENRLPQETPYDMVLRLAKAKAQAGLQYLQDNATDQQRPSHIIASDQTMVLGNTAVGKPHTVEKAKAQLRAMSGQTIAFHTSLSVMESATGKSFEDVDTTHVHFRALTDQQIDQYVQMEMPLHCAGSFKSEGAGILLCSGIEGKDPNALIGLPLVLLTDLMLKFEYQLPYTPPESTYS